MRLAIIPARGGSQRIKNKNIRDFCGRPLISYALATAKASQLFDEIHVSTDCDAIKSVVEKTGFRVPFLRDSKLADHHTGIFPVLKWVLQEFNRHGQTFSEICLLMATSPLLLPSDLVAGHQIFQDHQRAHPLMALSSFPVPIEWAMEDRGQNIFTPLDPEKIQIRSQDLTKKYYDAGAFVFYSAEQILNDVSGDTFLGYQLPKWRTVDIDDNEDFEMAEILYRGAQAAQQHGGKK